MKIICTNNEKENLIFVISKSTVCPSFENECPIEKGCRQCIEGLFDWEIIDEDK